jgi:hypothetical protein
MAAVAELLSLDHEMSAELKRCRRVLWIPGAMILLSSLLWIGGALMQITSTTSKDTWHTIPFNNHGTTHYLSWPVYYLPWVGLAIGVVGVLTYWILCRRIAARFRVSVDVVMGISGNEKNVV